MHNFTLQTHKETWEYELCPYPCSDTWHYLKITRYHKGKYCGEESVDLSEIDPEFLEVSCEKTPIVPLILAWMGTVFFIAVLTVTLLSLAFSKNLISAASCLFIPLVVGVYSLHYIIQRRKNRSLSTFIFGDGVFSRFQIPYMKGGRSKSYAFAREVAAFCNQALCEENEFPRLTHQFANGLAELRDTEVAVFNKEGVKCGGCAYISVVPGVYHHRESHMIRNFFCILTAFLFWFGTLVFIIGSAITLKDWEMIFGFSIMYVIPFVLGCFFFSKCKRSQDHYFAGCLSEEYDDVGIYLEVGQHPGSEKEFIDELNHRLRKAHNDRERQKRENTRSANKV